jgi:hypothetical protein
MIRKNAQKIKLDALTYSPIELLLHNVQPVAIGARVSFEALSTVNNSVNVSN